VDVSDKGVGRVRGDSVSELLREAVDALGAMDAETLRALCVEAEGLSKMDFQRNASEHRRAVELKGALAELLASTERSLRMLRGMREKSLRQIEEGVVWDL
jgi:hypothetical protein